MLQCGVYDSYLSVFLQRKEQENSDFINQIPVPVYDLKKKIIGIADHLLQKSVDLSQIQPSEMGVTVENTLPYFNEIIRDVIVPSELTYLESIKDNNAIDLKECIILLNMVLDHATESIQKSKLRYIFVDEFQDTDDVQIEVFQKIQKAIQLDCYLFVVGDLKQSIYRFRGAKLSAFDRLKEFKKYEWDIGYYSASKDDLQKLQKALEELNDIAKDFYEDFQNRPHNFREFYRRLKNYLQTDILEDRKLSDEFEDIIRRVLERLNAVENIDALGMWLRISERQLIGVYG